MSEVQEDIVARRRFTEVGPVGFKFVMLKQRTPEGAGVFTSDPGRNRVFDGDDDVVDGPVDLRAGDGPGFLQGSVAGEDFSAGTAGSLISQLFLPDAAFGIVFDVDDEKISLEIKKKANGAGTVPTGGQQVFWSLGGGIRIKVAIAALLDQGDAGLGGEGTGRRVL